MMKSTGTDVKSVGLSAMQHNAKAMVNLTLSYWQSTGDGLPPMRSGGKRLSSGGGEIKGSRAIGGHE